MNVTQLREVLQDFEARGLGLLETDAAPRFIEARFSELCLRVGFVQSGIVGKWVCESDQRMVGEREAFEIRDVPASITVCPRSAAALQPI
jgi:hypothetical protein